MKVRVRQIPIRVPGFRFAGVRRSLKESRERDVAVIASDVSAATAAAFTNRVKAAPVLVGIERAKAGRLQALVINSGSANAYTGRIICAAGYSGAVFDPQRVDVHLDNVQVVRRGEEIVGRVNDAPPRLCSAPSSR